MQQKQTLEENNTKRTSKKLQNDLFYSCDQRFYRVTQKLPNDVLKCREIKTEKYVYIRRLDWKKVGVRVYNRESGVDVLVDMSDVMCKAVICKNLIVAVFTEILLC
jgi:hypothetical protein